MITFQSGKNSRRILLLITCVLLLTTFKLWAQETPDASWITHPDISGHEFGVYHFRKTVELEKTPAHFNIQVSADNRYRLSVNGVSVAGHTFPSDPCQRP